MIILFTAIVIFLFFVIYEHIWKVGNASNRI